MPVASTEVLRAWYARLPDDGGSGGHPGRTLVAVLTAEFPAGTVVDLPAGRRPSGWQVAVRTDDTGRHVRSVEVAMPGAPLLWYVELPEPEPDAGPPATTLVAFSDPRCAEGTVLTEVQAGDRGVRGAGQVGAVRWWHGSGLVHQLYVAPEHRRRGVAGKLVQAAFGVQVARGRPHLHGDGRRTDDGEAFRGGLPGYAAWRLASRTHRLPSMTPGD